MEGLIILYIIFMLGGLILFCVAIGGGFSGVTNNVDVNKIKEHQYTEDEYITLFNYCINKRNTQLTKITNNSAYNIEYQKLTKMDQIIEPIRAEYHNPYKEPDYTDLCLRLLTLLTEAEQIEINYGRLPED